MNEFRQRCMETARRFLHTVVIVDDEAYIGESVRPRGLPVTPTRHTSTHRTEEKADREVERDEMSDHSLDAGMLVESFSRLGLICAVVAPRSGVDPCDIVDPSVKRTDIVILDWRLNGDNGEKTMSILNGIVKEDAGERLRLIAIYTGEREISGIGQAILESLSGSGLEFKHDKHNVELSYRHCRIAIYSKSDLPRESGLSSRSRSVSDLPQALIKDFAVMAEGLLPNIALTSLAAIRENVHKVLDRFDAKLDPALLTHRACLPVPGDSQQHMVSQLASELHAIMDDAVAADEPAGMDAIREWLNFTLEPDVEINFGEGKKASRDQTIVLLEKGLTNIRIDGLKRGKEFQFLTRGFSNVEDPDHLLDCQLAWMFNFRTVLNAPPPMLHLGTVLQRSDGENARYFLCMRPKCDSVRLREKTAFLLLPLVAPQSNSIQLVLHTGEDTYRRVSVCTEANQWSLVNFVPDENKGCVVAGGSSPCFYFTDENGDRFHRLGELKSEFAQRVAQHFSEGLSRVPVNNSEWLRREERL